MYFPVFTSDKNQWMSFGVYFFSENWCFSANAKSCDHQWAFTQSTHEYTSKRNKFYWLHWCKHYSLLLIVIDASTLRLPSTMLTCCFILTARSFYNARSTLVLDAGGNVALERRPATDTKRHLIAVKLTFFRQLICSHSEWGMPGGRRKERVTASCL